MQFISWLIIAILASAFVPSIMDTLIAVDTTGWPAVAILVWDNLPVFIIVGVLFIILRRTGLLGGRTNALTLPLLAPTLAGLPLPAMQAFAVGISLVIWTAFYIRHRRAIRTARSEVASA